MKQIDISLPAFERGFHLITGLIESRLPALPRTGMIHIFLCHTSAAICLNENADLSVRDDFESFMNKLIPENDPVYTHILEGADDMPAHLKSSLLGQSLLIPLREGQLALGTWQGIYLCEFRNRGGSRRLIVTISGEE